MVAKKSSNTQSDGEIGPAGAIHISPVHTSTMDVVILGTSPIIMNRMSEKARRDILMPRGRLTTADKQTNLKHDPISEYQASPYTLVGDDAPAYLAVMSSAFKGAMMTAALDMPGAKKAQIGRLVYVEGDYVAIFGVPQMFMSIVRSADINKTPDVRTRAIIPEWAAMIRVRFVTPMLNDTSIINLIAAGGITSGIGDWRPEKGKGSYGQYEVRNPGDPDVARIMKEGGRAAQIKAMQEPESYDHETDSLLEWFQTAAKLRGIGVPSMKRGMLDSRKNGHATLVTT